MVLFYALDLNEKQFTGRDLLFRVHGKVFKTNDPLQFDVNNVGIVMDYSNHGFVLEVMCNYPDAFL